MKVIISLLIICTLVNTNLAQEDLLKRKVSIEFTNIQLHEAIYKLQEVSEIQFAFNNNLPGMHDIINTKFIQKSIETILNELLTSKALLYKIIGDKIILYPKNTSKEKIIEKKSTIEGTVIDEKSNEPISMINVAIIGTNRGTVTDSKGKFKIDKLSSGKYSILVSSIGYASKKIEDLEIFPEKSKNIGVVKLEQREITLNEIVITPGTFSIMGTEPLSKQTLDREDFKNMSFSEDITRAVSRLPGVSSNDFSSKFTIRGGETDEVLITLDGMELFDPFHQRDFSGGLFSIVDIEAVEGVDLLTGGFSSEYGRKQSGVFKMKTKEVNKKRFSSIGLSIMNARLYTEGTFSNEEGSYLISARRGMLDQTFKLIDETENIPIYYDVLAKVKYKINEKHTFSIHALQAGDKTEVRDVVTGEVDYDIHDTWYNNSYSWITLESVYNSLLFSKSILYGGYITHNRKGSAFKVGFSDKVKFRLSDKRELKFWGIKQDWNWKVQKQVMLKGGVDFRQLYSDYNYSLSLTDVRVNNSGFVEDYFENREFEQKPDGNQIGIYFSSSILALPKLFIEPGIRFDYTSYTNENNWSPRLGLAYAFSNRTFLRTAFGYYYQSQFINNLEINFGSEKFRKSELSKHYVLGIEHTFSNGLNLKVEGYYKDISLPTVNYQNLRDQWEVFPEVRNDVVKMNINEARSRGIEIFLKYDIGKYLSWWFSYSYSKSEENIQNIEFDGLLQEQLGWLPRVNNQNHTIYADINFKLSDSWVLNFSWQYWSGWPLTIYDYEFTELNSGELHFYPKHTTFKGKTYPDYHRLDLRINYHFVVAFGKISTYLHIINLYNRENLRKYDLDVRNNEENLVPDGNGGYIYSRDDKNWFGITPVIGINWEF